VGCGGAALAVLLVCAATASSAAAQASERRAPRADAPDEAALFRVFLKDGSSMASVGECARVGDRVVFALPISATRQPAVSLAASEVDWARTDGYANAVRAARYAATRGEADFAAMSALVARTLSDIAVTPGRSAQLALAERARRMLADWPREHYGYRSAEVRQTLALVADTPPPAVEPILGPPTLQEAIEQALRLSTLADSAAERVAVLEQAQEALAEAGAVPPADAAWVDSARRRTAAALDVEHRTDSAYRALTQSTMRRVDRRAARSDVRGLLRVRAQVVERDRTLGRRRPGEIEALLATIDDRLDAARRLRLARDQWMARAPALRAYRDAVRPALERLRDARALLADIRTLAGPPAVPLATFLRQLDALAPFVRAITVPDEAREAHAALQSALQLAGTAARYRQRAVAANDMRAAWDASAAAAGALLFTDRTALLGEALLTAPAASTGTVSPGARAAAALAPPR
jgi:hypothetical protein